MRSRHGKKASEGTVLPRTLAAQRAQLPRSQSAPGKHRDMHMLRAGPRNHGQHAHVCTHKRIYTEHLSLFFRPGLHKQFPDSCSRFQNSLLIELIPGIGNLGLNWQGVNPSGLCLPAPGLCLLLPFLPGPLEQSLESVCGRLSGPELANRTLACPSSRAARAQGVSEGPAFLK